MASENTEVLLVTDRRSFQYPTIVLGDHVIEWQKSNRYLGVQLDRRLSFGEHLQIAIAKAIQCEAALTRLMRNIGGPREAKRRLVASVVNSKLLHAAPVWTSALNNHAIQKKLFSAQRGVVLKIVSAYRTVSTSAGLVLASVPPINVLAEERKKSFQLRKELTCLTNLQEIARAKEAIRKDGRRIFVEKWHGDQSGRCPRRSGEESLYSSPGWRGYSACLTGVFPRMGVPGERMTEELYATLSWNQPPAKLKAERRFRGRCIGFREGVFGFNGYA